MFSQQFIRSQKKLQRISVIILWSQRIVVMTALVLFGICSIVYTPTETSYREGKTQDGGYLLAIAFVVFVLGFAIHAVLRWYMRKRLWDAYSLQNGSVASYGLADQIPFIPAGPVVSSGSTGYQHNNLLTSQQDGYQIQFCDVSYKYPLIASLTFDLRYLVISLPIGALTPHIFIDGRSQNRFNADSTDLWSLHAKLHATDRLPDLEGDFYRYFNVYSQDKEYLTTLSILAPDSMIKLCDQGYSFDYELYDGTLYVIHDYNILTPQDFEALLAALSSCLHELVPQIAKQRYQASDRRLRITTGRMKLRALGYACRQFGVSVVFIVLSVVIGVVIGQTII